MTLTQLSLPLPACTDSVNLQKGASAHHVGTCSAQILVHRMLNKHNTLHIIVNNMVMVHNLWEMASTLLCIVHACVKKCVQYCIYMHTYLI